MKITNLNRPDSVQDHFAGHFFSNPKVKGLILEWPGQNFAPSFSRGDAVQ